MPLGIFVESVEIANDARLIFLYACTFSKRRVWNSFVIRQMTWRLFFFDSMSIKTG